MKSFAFFLILLGSATAQDLTSERLWKGTNGNAFRGIYIKTIADGQKVEIASSSGKIFTVALENLSEPDRKLILAGSAKPANPTKDQTPGEFKPLPPIDRPSIANAPNKNDGLKWPNSITQAVGGFFYLWDVSGLIEIPRRGDASKKCDWLIDKLKRKISPRNAKLSSHDEIMEGMADYFESELKEVATYRFHLVVNPTPERMAEFTEAGDACFIKISNDGWGIWLPVVDVQANNIIRVCYEGKILYLKWTAGQEGRSYFDKYKVPMAGTEPQQWDPCIEYLKANKLKPQDLKTPTLEVTNKDDVPSHWSGDELVFSMSTKNPMIVCRPYVFADPEKTGPPPPEPGFGPPPGEK
ncbi:hypothetical protein [Haloferula sp.]|uniref:hypothetical protein n=1 Tax=Haloferula sp. TaxID=2497595 RepID=UPI0032A0196B